MLFYIAVLLLTTTVAEITSQQIQDDGTCSILGLFEFTKGQWSPGRYKDLSSDLVILEGYTRLASAVLAVKHFNERSSSVINELGLLSTGGDDENDDYDCDDDDVQLTLHAGDNRSDRDSINEIVQYSNEESICAIVGPRTHFETNQVQSLASAMSISHMVIGIPHTILFKGGSRSTALNFNIRDDDLAIYILQYIQQFMDCNHLVLLSTKRPIAEDISHGMIRNAPNYGIRLKMFDTELDYGFDDGAAAIMARDTGIKIIMLVETTKKDYIKLANKLNELNMLTDDYIYILYRSCISHSTIGDDYGHIEINSPLDKLLRGALVIDIVEPYTQDNNNDDRFLQAWKEQDGTFVETVNSLVPNSTKDKQPYYQAASDFFTKHLPARDSSLIYDAVIATGMGACKMHATQKNDRSRHPQGAGGGSPTIETTKPKAPKKVNELNSYVMNIEFNGASGLVRFSSSSSSSSSSNGEENKRWEPGSRDPDSLSIGAFNLRPSTIDANSTSHKYRAVMVAVTDNSGNFQPVDDERFVYSDGTTNPPPVQFEIINQNLLPRWARVVGFSLMTLAWVLSCGCIWGVYIQRKEAVIKAAQPFFLHLLCIGSLLQSTAIFTLSLDEQTGWSTRQLSIACMTTPWLFCVGQILSFSALFTKLMRVDRVLQFRRNQVVHVSHVIRPLLGLMLVTLAILSIWTVVDPWTWEIVIYEDALPSESYGRCRNNNLWVYFGPLFGLLALSNFLAVYWALKTSDVPLFLCETKGVILVTLQQSQAWVTGVPILAVLGNSSVTATYLGRVTLIWLFAVLPVASLVATKLSICRSRQESNNSFRSTMNQGQQVRISGLTAPPSSPSKLEPTSSSAAAPTVLRSSLHSFVGKKDCWSHEEQRRPSNIDNNNDDKDEDKDEDDYSSKKNANPESYRNKDNDNNSMKGGLNTTSLPSFLDDVSGEVSETQRESFSASLNPTFLDTSFNTMQQQSTDDDDVNG